MRLFASILIGLCLATTWASAAFTPRGYNGDDYAPRFHAPVLVGGDGDYGFRLKTYALGLDAASVFVDWAYDAFGRKAMETVYTGAKSLEVASQTLYTYDGWQLLAETDVESRKNRAEYVYGPGYIDDVVASYRDTNGDGDYGDASELRYHLTDQQYSTVALLDAAGGVIERYGYDAFGTPTIYNPAGGVISSSALSNAVLYTGRPWMGELTAYDLRNRHYAPASGRFLTTDAVFDAGNLGNPYTYVGNNPFAFVDPMGDVAETVWDVASIGLGVVSLGQNLAEGNYGSATLDAAGVVVDSIAAVVPFVPGGAGALIKGARVAGAAVEAGQTAAAVGGAVSEGDYAGAALGVAGAVAPVPTVGAGKLGAVAGDAAGDATKAARKVPNPGGRLGDATTRETTRSVKEALERKGYRVRTEQGFEKAAPGTGSRYADVVGTKKDSGNRVIINIGKMTQKGEPVARERRALEDLRNSPKLKPGDQVFFIEKGASGLPSE